MVAVVEITNVNIEGATVLGADLYVQGSWGFALTDHASVDVSGKTPAQVLTGLKNRVIAWAASALGGSQTITANQVWVFGAPS